MHSGEMARKHHDFESNISKVLLSFCFVDLCRDEELPVQAYTDNDVSTTFDWQRPHVLSSQSTATLTWRIPADVVAGNYRLRHRGDYKHIFGGTTPFTGVSRARFCCATG
jgi:hypothetical protein